MSAQPFHDFTETEFRRHDRASEKRGRLALIRNATAAGDALDYAASPEASGDEVQQDVSHDAARVKGLLGDFAHTTDAMSLFLAGTGVRCPPQFRALIDAVVGIAGNRTEWFNVTDEVISRRAGRSKKWVQTQRKEFLEWETKHKKTFIEIQDSYTDADMKHHSHKYRVHIGTFAANIKLDAQHLPEWNINPGKALEIATLTYRDSLPNTPPRTARRRTPTPSETELMHRQIKRARTCLANATNLRPLDGSPAWVDGELVTEIESLLAEIRSIGGLPSVQTSTTKEAEVVETNHHEIPTQDTLRMEVEAVEADDNSRVEKSSTCENIDPNADFDDFADIIAFPDEPDELTYELDDNNLDDDDLAIIAAERDAIQAEANGLPLEVGEWCESPEMEKSTKVTASTTQPTTQPPTTTATITTSPPIETDDGNLPETELNYNETISESHASPDIENLRKAKVVPDESAPKSEPHGFGGAAFKWSFPTASGASSYTPNDER
jgi:hypothetical protein